MNMIGNLKGYNAKKCTYPGVKKDCYLITDDGKVYSLLTDKFLSLKLTSDGYYEVALCSDITPSKRKYVRVHRLVAYQFVPNPNNYPVVDHLDCDKGHNHYTNLEWVTVLENTQRAVTNGLVNGIKRPVELVIQICELFELGYSSMEVFCNLTPYGKRISDDPSLYRFIDSIRHRKSWNEITKNYSYTLESTSNKKKNFRYTTERKGVYSEELIRKICELLQDGKSPKEILLYFYPDAIGTRDKKYRKLYCLISNIRQRNNWDYITKDYTWTINDAPVSIQDDKIYQYFCQGMSRDEVKRMIGLTSVKDNKKLYQRMQNCYHKYLKIHSLSNNETITIYKS